MRFIFASNRGRQVLRAVFEDGDQYTGHRQEGSGTVITYSGEDITFDYVAQTIHPDILGLLCLIIFYPFIGRRVLFPMPVSPRLKQAFSNQHFKRQFRFDNVDPSIKMYTGTKIALSFGGGIDSTAVRAMFPEAFIVHEAHIRRGQPVPSYSHSIVHNLGSDRGRVVTTNQRFVSRPKGWHGWPCALATTLLMATDYDFGIIMTGSVIGSTLLRSGARYWNRFDATKSHGITGNFWQSAFNIVGMPVFSPVHGASEFLTTDLSLPYIQAGEVISCTERHGGACRLCPKCFRRDIVRAAIDPEYRPHWNSYDHDRICKYLEARPLHMGHLFSFARDRVNKLPPFIVSRLNDLPSIESDWPLRVHPRTFDFCDETWREAIRSRVLGHLTPMEPAHITEMESWDLTGPGEYYHPGYSGA